MSNNLAYGLGFVLGVVLISVIILIPMLIGLTKDGKIKRKYDERQEVIRGRGFKRAFYTMVVLNILYGVTHIGFQDLPGHQQIIPIVPSAVVMFITLIGVGVYAWYCILNDGYFALNEKVPQTIIAFSLIALFNFLVGINNLLDGEMIEDGIIQCTCINLVCAIFLLITVFVILIKQHRDKRED